MAPYRGQMYPNTVCTPLNTLLDSTRFMKTDEIAPETPGIEAEEGMHNYHGPAQYKCLTAWSLVLNVFFYSVF